MSNKMVVSHHDTLVQEENYLSQSKHIWQGDIPTISAHVVRAAVSAERDHPLMGSWANSPLGIRGAKTFIEKPQKGGVYTTFKV